MSTSIRVSACERGLEKRKDESQLAVEVPFDVLVTWSTSLHSARGLEDMLQQVKAELEDGS